MSDLIQYIKLKLRRTSDSPEIEILDEGELALNKETKELKIGTSNGESWNQATSLNRIRQLSNTNDNVYPGEMVYKNNQLKINLTNNINSWNNITSLNHIKSHNNSTTNIDLNQGEMSFNIETGELLIKGEKLFTVNRIPRLSNIDANNIQINELYYNIDSKQFEIKTESGTIEFNKVIPVKNVNDNTYSSLTLTKEDNIYSLDNIKLNAFNTTDDGLQPISSLNYNKTTNTLHYGDTNMNKILYLASTEKEESRIDDEGQPIIIKIYEFKDEENLQYPSGTLIYDKTRNCLLIADGINTLNSLNPIGGSSSSIAPTVLGIPEEEFGSGELI